MSAYKVINGITIYRIVAAPFLLWLLYNDYYDWFKWLLMVSFLTDAIDGYLARKFKVNSKLGATLDSIGDDLTVGVAIIGMFIMYLDFLTQHLYLVIAMLGLYLFQNIISLLRYNKLSSFHTYSAKAAAVLQALFLMSAFFMTEPIEALFYFAGIITIVDLIEEVILVFLLKDWQTDVKGLYWVMRNRK